MPRAVQHSPAQPATSAAARSEMPKKLLQQIAPSAARLRRWGALDHFGEDIYRSSLWHMNRYSASMAFFVGPFVAFTPVPGQMLLAALAALVLRCNLPLSVGLVWITNPLTAPAVLYAAYSIGALLLGLPPVTELEFQADIVWLWREFGQVWKPFLLGCFTLGLFTGSLGYFLINTLWRWRVQLQWRRRKKSRAALRNRPAGR